MSRVNTTEIKTPNYKPTIYARLTAEHNSTILGYQGCVCVCDRRDPNQTRAAASFPSISCWWLVLVDPGVGSSTQGRTTTTTTSIDLSSCQIDSLVRDRHGPPHKLPHLGPGYHLPGGPIPPLLPPSVPLKRNISNDTLSWDGI